jgi:hypothetical protein
VRHNNQYSFDSDPLFFLSDDTWPVVRESSQPDCSITSLSAATNGERRFDTMTITERISTDSTSTAPRCRDDFWVVVNQTRCSNDERPNRRLLHPLRLSPRWLITGAPHYWTKGALVEQSGSHDEFFASRLITF